MGMDDLGRDILSRVHLWHAKVASGGGVVSVGLGDHRRRSHRGHCRLHWRLDGHSGDAADGHHAGLSGSAAGHRHRHDPRPWAAEHALYAIAIVSIPAYARIVRASVLSVKAQDYILASRSLGCSPFPHPRAPRVAQLPHAAHRTGPRWASAPPFSMQPVLSFPRTGCPAADARMGCDAGARPLRRVHGAAHRCSSLGWRSCLPYSASTCWATGCATLSTHA